MKDTVIYEGDGEYGHYKIVDRIYEDRPTRLLLSAHGAPQSGMARDDEPELIFDYIQRMLEIALSVRPRSVLVIGGGAFTLPKALLERLDIVRCDVVEIEPLLPHLARQYFDLPHDLRLHIHTMDGREYLDSCTTKYDLIFIDAFREFDIPRSLLSVEAAEQYARLLAPQGVIVLNFIARYWGIRRNLTHQLLATFDSSFQTVELYPADPHYGKRGEQNLLLVAHNSSTEINLDYLQSAPVEPQFIPADDVRVFDK